MQGHLIFGLFMIAALSSPSIAAVEQPKSQTCARGEQPQQQARQPQQRQQWAQQEQQQRNKPHGCPVYRNIPSVVGPTPTFLL